MHYKNGREAHEGDSVVHLDPYTKAYSVGVLSQLNAGSTACNGRLSVIWPGIVEHTYVTVGDCLHAQDAYDGAGVKRNTPKRGITDLQTPATGLIGEVQS